MRSYDGMCRVWGSGPAIHLRLDIIVLFLDFGAWVGIIAIIAIIV